LSPVFGDRVGDNFCATICFSIWIGDRQAAVLRLADQQMNVFRHDHIAEDTRITPAAHALQRLLKDATRLRAAQQR
jgi:hypothetical protein